MIRHHSLKVAALTSLMALAFGTIGCSGGSSPTEPADFDEPVLATSTTAGSVVTAESKGRGSDDTAGDDNGGDNNRQKGKGRGRGRGGRGGRNGGDDNGGGNNGGGNNGGGTRPAGQEFEGSVASVGQNAVTLANGTRILVNAQTQWVARGDLHSLNEVARSVNAGRPTRVEGRGTRQSNGTFVAATIKAEVDN